MLDTIFINREESAKLLGIGVEKFDRQIRPHIQTIDLGGKVLFKLEEIQSFSDSLIAKSKQTNQKIKPTVDGQGKVLRPCDEDTAKLKETYKKLPKGTRARLDSLLMQLQKVADKAHGRLKG